jgi:hypothetical protein
MGQCSALQESIVHYSELYCNAVNQGLSKHQEVSSTPVTKVKKNDCGFLGPSWCNKKVNPETYVQCGSYELLLGNLAHQMKEKLTILNKFSHF